VVDDTDGSAAARVFGPRPRIVLRLPRLQVHTGSRIQGIIGATGKVEVIEHGLQYSRSAVNLAEEIRQRELCLQLKNIVYNHVYN